MATYAIGDVQGCFSALRRLLQAFQFNPFSDRLWFVGDIINRGPESLQTLRFIRQLNENQHQCVLGNHDLHLLACADGGRALHRGDTIQAILAADDAEDLLHWLRHRPLMIFDEALAVVLVHAGIAPMWDLTQARSCAAEVEQALRGDDYVTLLKGMYGNTPERWQDDLSGIARLRCIINYFTRMRFCLADGSLDLSYKGTIAEKPPALIPWFEVQSRKLVSQDIVFGHWAALAGKVALPHLFPIDTGCVWGNKLSALRLEDKVMFAVEA